MDLEVSRGGHQLHEPSTVKLALALSRQQAVLLPLSSWDREEQQDGRLLLGTSGLISFPLPSSSNAGSSNDDHLHPNMAPWPVIYGVGKKT